MPFQTWMPVQPRSETVDAPFVSAAFGLNPSDGYIVFHVLPQGVIGVAGQVIHWFIECRKTGATEWQQVAGASVDCSLDSSITKAGFFGGEANLYGGDFEAVRGGYYTVNGPITFGAEGDVRPAQKAKRH